MSRSSRALWGAVIAAMAALALPSLASAATTCVFATVGLTPTLSVNHSDGISDVTIRRVPLPADPTQATIEVFEGATNLTCTGGPVSVTQVDTIAYDNSGGISDLILVEPETFVPGPRAARRCPRSRRRSRTPAASSATSSCATGTGSPTATSSAPSAGRARARREREPDDPVPDADITLVAPFFRTSSPRAAPGPTLHERRRGRGRRAVRAPLTLNGGPGADTLTGGGRAATPSGTTPATT